MNVCLSEDDDQSGALLGVYGGEVRRMTRTVGEATCHSSRLLHAVSKIADGSVRYSLIVFFDRKGRAAGRWASRDAAGHE